MTPFKGPGGIEVQASTPYEDEQASNRPPLHGYSRVVLYFIACSGQIYIGSQGYATKREAYKALWALKSAIWQVYARAPRCYFLRNVQNLCNMYTVKERLM